MHLVMQKDVSKVACTSCISTPIDNPTTTQACDPLTTNCLGRSMCEFQKTDEGSCGFPAAQDSHPPIISLDHKLPENFRKPLKNQMPSPATCLSRWRVYLRLRLRFVRRRRFSRRFLHVLWRPPHRQQPSNGELISVARTRLWSRQQPTPR